MDCVYSASFRNCLSYLVSWWEQFQGCGFDSQGVNWWNVYLECNVGYLDKSEVIISAVNRLTNKLQIFQKLIVINPT